MVEVNGDVEVGLAISLSGSTMEQTPTARCKPRIHQRRIAYVEIFSRPSIKSRPSPFLGEKHEQFALLYNACYRCYYSCVSPLPNSIRPSA